MITGKPWLKYYELHVPEHIEYPTKTLPELLDETVRRNPDFPAMIFKGNKITFEEMNTAINRIAASLQALGVKKGDRVALHMPNCPQYPISYFAVLRIGAIVVPCNPLYQAHEMTYQLNDSGAEVIITLSSFYPVIRQIREKTKLRHVVVAEIKTFFPAFLKLMFSLLVEKKTGHKVSLNGDQRTHLWTQLLAKSPGIYRPVDLDLEDTAILMYTGGTTGVSKGAELTHRNIMVNAYQCKVWLNGEESKERTLVQVPLFHCYGMTTCMNLCAIIAGTQILIPDPRNLEDVIKTIHTQRPTLYPGVPAMYNAINNYPNLSKYDLSSIKACISGAAGLPVEVQEQFQDLTGARLVEGYGLSEASPVTHANPVFGRNCVGTIGVPWPDTEVKIVDVDTGTETLGVGEVGELCIRGPQVMKGYWNNPAETALSLRSSNDGGDPWLHTGDIATMDSDGYYKIVDRKKDMILGNGGYNIYPREIEDLLYTHPKVLEAGAVGIPTAGKGERIKIYIVLKDGETAGEQEFIDFCRANLAPYKIPKYVEFRDELPKSTVGKILRRQLVTEEMQSRAAESAT